MFGNITGLISKHKLNQFGHSVDMKWLYSAVKAWVDIFSAGLKLKLCSLAVVQEAQSTGKPLGERWEMPLKWTLGFQHGRKLNKVQIKMAQLKWERTVQSENDPLKMLLFNSLKAEQIIFQNTVM